MAPPVTSAAAAASAGEAEFGVPECDAYLKAYVQCVESKVPKPPGAVARQPGSVEAGLEASGLHTPGQGGLVMACTQARDASRMAMKAYGCEL